MSLTNAADTSAALASGTLSYKPDFEQVKEAWAHYWAGEPWRRPLLQAIVPRDPAQPWRPEADPFTDRYLLAMTGQWDELLRRIDNWLESYLYLAEAIPYFSPDFGPDQFAAYLGAPLRYSPASRGTNWVEPIVDDWDAFTPEIRPDNPVWTGMLGLSRRMAEHARGRYLVGVCDLHSNADTLSALRGPDRLCLDLLLAPESIERVMRAVRALYQPVYQGLYEAGQMGRQPGTIGWEPFWCPGHFATIQCDFICMVSPETARRLIIPALEEEADSLDHCAYHLDGPGALAHLDDILAIRKIDVIQWVSGAGQAPMWQWLDVLKKIQRAGKGLHIYDLNTEQVKLVHRELGPAGILYTVSAGSADEVRELTDWLERNT